MTLQNFQCQIFKLLFCLPICQTPGGGFEKLDFGLAYLKEGCAHFLVGNLLDGKAFKAKNVLVEGDSLVKGGDSYTHMFDMRNVHNGINLVECLFTLFSRLPERIFGGSHFYVCKFSK